MNSWIEWYFLVVFVVVQIDFFVVVYEYCVEKNGSEEKTNEKDWVSHDIES